MNPPRPVPRLGPRGDAAVTPEHAELPLGVADQDPGVLSHHAEQLARGRPGAADEGVDANAVRGALQLTHEPPHPRGRPTLPGRVDLGGHGDPVGPEISADLERRGGGGDAKHSAQDAGGHQRPGLGGSAQRRVGRLLAGEGHLHLGTQLTTEAEGGEAQQLLPARHHLGDALVVGPQRAGGDRLPDRHPRRPHVREVERSRLGMLEIADQLAQHPRLIRVRHPPVDALLHGDGEHLRPRQMVERHPAQLATVHLHRMHAGGGAELVRHRHHGVEAVVPAMSR